MGLSNAAKKRRKFQRWEEWQERLKLESPSKRTSDEWYRLIPKLAHWAFAKSTKRELVTIK